MHSSKPVRVVDKKTFKSYQTRQIEVHPHALNHLGKGQRKVFKEKELLEMLEERPRKVFEQENKRYAAFYRRTDGYRKLILSVESTKTVIVTFMDVQEIPRYKNA